MLARGTGLTRVNTTRTILLSQFESLTRKLELDGPAMSTMEEEELGLPSPTESMMDADFLLQIEQLQKSLALPPVVLPRRTFTAYCMELLERIPYREKLTPRVRGLILLNVLVGLVASNWVIIKDTGTFFDPFTFASLRFGVASLAFTPFWEEAFNDQAILTAGAELGLWSGLGYLTQTLGLITTDASRASFFSTFTVLTVPLLAGLTGHKIKKTTWVAVIGSILGVSLLENSGSPPGIGDLWSLLSAFFFGVQIFRTEHHAKALPEGSALPLLGVIIPVITAMALACAAASHPGEALHWAAHPGGALRMMASPDAPWGQILYTGLLSTDLALLIELVALKDVSSTDAAIIYTLEPVLGAGLAFAVLGERWGPAGWVGAGLIVGSSLVTQVIGSEEPVKQE